MAEKLSFRILEGRIRPFTDSLVPENIERLKGHTENLKKYHNNKDWKNLHREQLLAHRSAQQLKSNLTHLEQCRKLVNDDEMVLFNELLNPFKEKVLKTLEDFGVNQLHYSKESELDVEFSSLSLDDQVALVPPSEEDTIQSWETLLSDLKELQSLTNELYNVVDSHQEVIDRIENHLEDAELKIQQGKEQLAKASYLKAAMLPVAGAVVGGVVGLAVGGPIGLVVGSKLAFVAVATGGVVAGTSAGVAAKKIQNSRNPKKND